MDTYTYQIAVAGNFRVLDTEKVMTPVNNFCQKLCGDVFPSLRKHNLRFNLAESVKNSKMTIQFAIQELCRKENYSFETKFMRRHSLSFFGMNAMVSEMLEDADRVFYLRLEWEAQYNKQDKVTQRILDQASDLQIPITYFTYSSLMVLRDVRYTLGDPLEKRIGIV